MEKGTDSDNRQANEYVNTHHQCYFPTVSELFEAVQNTLNVIQDDSDTVVSRAYLNDSYLYTTAVYDQGNRTSVHLSIILLKPAVSTASR